MPLTFFVSFCVAVSTSCCSHLSFAAADAFNNVIVCVCLALFLLRVVVTNAEATPAAELTAFAGLVVWNFSLTFFYRIAKCCLNFFRVEFSNFVFLYKIYLFLTNHSETPVVEKVAAEEVDAVKKDAVAADDAAAETPTTTENGAGEESSSSVDGAKENGAEASAEAASAADAVDGEKTDAAAPADEKVEEEAEKTTAEAKPSSEAAAAVENGADDAEAANGDSKGKCERISITSKFDI